MVEWFMRFLILFLGLFLFGCGVGGVPLYPEGSEYPREYPN